MNKETGKYISLYTIAPENNARWRLALKLGLEVTSQNLISCSNLGVAAQERVNTLHGSLRKLNGLVCGFGERIVTRADTSNIDVVTKFQK